MTKFGEINSSSNMNAMLVSVGTATLSGGSVTVNNSSVAADSLIVAFPQNGILNFGFLNCSTRNPGVSFTIQSSNILDARTVAYFIFQPV